MRRWALLIAGGAVWLLLFAVPVLADNGPHQAGQFVGMTTDACASCHRAHTATAENLLLQEQPGLCYSCHGAGATGASTDVQDGGSFSAGTVHSGTPSGALRGGGFEYALINTASYTGSLFGGAVIGTLTNGVATTSAHSVDGSPQMMWGNGPISDAASYGEAAVNLTCGSCHDPHGNGQYRILKPGPADSGIANTSHEAGYSDGGRVYINDATPKVYTTTNYALSGDANSPNNPDGNALDYNVNTKNWTGSYAGASSRWCSTCHTRYLAPSGSATTPSGDAVFMFRHGIYNPVDPNVAGYGTDAAGNIVQPQTGTGITTHAPACITCHVAHGSDASMTDLITGQTFASEPGGPALDSTLLRLNNRGVCESCHNK